MLPSADPFFCQSRLLSKPTHSTCFASPVIVTTLRQAICCTTFWCLSLIYIYHSRKCVGELFLFWEQLTMKKERFIDSCSFRTSREIAGFLNSPSSLDIIIYFNANETLHGSFNCFSSFAKRLFSTEFHGLQPNSRDAFSNKTFFFLPLIY